VSRDPRIDDKIARAAPFARAILDHLRALVHRAVPEAGEAIKWGMPHFTYKGKNIAGMAAFKAHCMFAVHGAGRQGEGDGMGSYGKIVSLADLPPEDELVARLREACARIDGQGSAVSRPAAPRPKRTIDVPEDFSAALAASPAAEQFFDGLAPSHRYEYLEWITEAKRPETRAKRIGARMARGRKAAQLEVRALVQSGATISPAFPADERP
jgi:uncharacterized protein YdeI (YjbR/CyaY-like superfamily)